MSTPDVKDEPQAGSSEPLPSPRPRRTRTRVFEPRLSQVARTLNEQSAVLRYSSAFNEYVCECGRKTCHDVVALSIEEYRAIRTDRTHFLIAHGHCPVGARVVREIERCQVIALVTRSPGEPGLS